MTHLASQARSAVYDVIDSDWTPGIVGTVLVESWRTRVDHEDLTDPHVIVTPLAVQPAGAGGDGATTTLRGFDTRVVSVRIVYTARAEHTTAGGAAELAEYDAFATEVQDLIEAVNRKPLPGDFEFLGITNDPVFDEDDLVDRGVFTSVVDVSYTIDVETTS